MTKTTIKSSKHQGERGPSTPAEENGRKVKHLANTGPQRRKRPNQNLQKADQDDDQHAKECFTTDNNPIPFIALIRYPSPSTNGTNPTQHLRRFVD